MFFILYQDDTDRIPCRPPAPDETNTVVYTASDDIETRIKKAEIERDLHDNIATGLRLQKERQRIDEEIAMQQQHGNKLYETMF